MLDPHHTVRRFAPLLAFLAACGGSAGTSATGPGAIRTVTVTIDALGVAVGDSTTAHAVVRDGRGTVLSPTSVSWASSDAAVATVRASATASCGIDAVGVGSATITATAEGASGSVLVTVTPSAVTTVDVAFPVSRIGRGQTTQAFATPRDASGRPLMAAPVVWSSATPAVATVSASGLVTAVAPGTVAITASAWGVEGVALLTVADAGAPASLVAVSALSQTGPPGRAAAQAPAVRVLDALGVGVPGVPVSFVVASGGGDVSGSPATTDAEGVARATSWTFGSDGAQTVRASTAQLPAASEDFAGLARDPASAFDVTLRLRAGMSDAQARAFVHAKERIEQIVAGALPSVAASFTFRDMAGCGAVPVQEVVDDVLVVAEVTAIDGAGGILGQAGPCFLRDGSFLPYIGHMQFDSADLAALENQGQLEAVILHEMLHVLGFGAIWTDLGLLDAITAPGEPFFQGAEARADFSALNGGAAFTGNPVPVEGAGGSGTANSHWRESVLKGELMTGWLNRGSTPLSATTVGSLQDLGYQVDVSSADPFDLATALRAAPEAGAGSAVLDWPLDLTGDVRREPPVVTDLQGRPVR